MISTKRMARHMDCVNALGPILMCVRDHTRDLLAHLVRGSVAANAETVDLAMTLAKEVDLLEAHTGLSQRNPFSNLCRDLNSTLDHALYLARHLDNHRLDPAFQDVERLVIALNDARRFIDSMVEQQAPARHGASPVLVARRLLNGAVKALPACHRSRYSEEFRSELHDLATARATHFEQVWYALRQINLAFELRAELRRPARRGARP
ncbi:hypothetical protein [Krasilnikovia sp. MM14-A1259]|uniref:hypothetical protein n=1 Tax=Krasilnikovia sp. MM14-A1259 TaxID=3373539 RepID=UPI00381B4E83